MAATKRRFYGWYLLGAAWVLYGFGITPGYVSWGFFAPEMMRDLDLTRGQVGLVFGIFTFLYSAAGPFVGIAQAKYSIRIVMTLGAATAAIGFFLMSRADSMAECLLGYALLGGLGIGFSTIVPCQTLGQNWFLKRRALAIALILAAGGIVGRLWPPVNVYMLDHGGWRSGWLAIAAVSAALALVAALFVRDTPEQMGQLRDGAPPEEGPEDDGATSAGEEDGPQWTAAQAIRTPQFVLLVLCGIAYALPWGVTVSHGRLHLGDLGYSKEVAGAIIGTMFLVSVVGRLSGSLGDILRAQWVLAFALLLEGFGIGGLLYASSSPVAYLCVSLLGLGFGAAYISIPVVFSDFFGRKAFGTTTGMRILITGIFNGLGPWAAGRFYDSRGSYAVPFLALVVLCWIGTVAALACRNPGPPPAAKQEN